MKWRVAPTNRYYVTAGLFGLLCLSVFAYMYFLGLSVVHVVTQEELERESKLLVSQIADLESAYIEAQHKVNQKMAQRGEFNALGEKIFIARNNNQSLVLISNSNIE